jgi:3-hydroxybutyryl-CoA dehydrogenase
MSRADADASLGRIATVVTLPDVCVAKLVIEAIVEDLAAKRELLERVENVVDADCIIATNTSSLSITTLGAHAKHPERIVGMHFFNPAPLMPLVEVVTGLVTSREVAEATFATALAWGKTPVYATSTPGSSSTAVRAVLRRRLALLVERAADVATLDAVFRECGGFRMGPFELIDLIGLDVNLAVTKSIWAAYFHDPATRRRCCRKSAVAAGFYGRKSGRGFYDHAPAPRKRSQRASRRRRSLQRDRARGARHRRTARRAHRGGRRAPRTHACRFAFSRRALHVPGSGGGSWLALDRRAHGDEARRRQRRPRSRAVRSGARLCVGDPPRGSQRPTRAVPLRSAPRSARCRLRA